MSAKLRLMFSSNIMGCPSGYGVQAASLLPRLAELPEFGGRENIAQHAWYGLHGLTLNYNGFQIYPGFDDPYGNDVMGAHCAHFGANLFCSLIDIWVLHQAAEKVAPALFIPWLPIDHDPIPQPFFDALKGAHLPLTYSKWGHKMLAAAGVPNEYIAHGIETSIYRVNENREEVRKFKKWLTKSDDTHLSVIVAANKGFPDRKWFQGQLECWRDFARDKPNAKLYIHSLSTSVHGGVNFETLVSMLGLDGRVIFPQPYLYRLGYPPEHLALVYNAADVLLAASMSEGFGIPIIEAQAAGCPVITTNFSAMPELLRWGHLVDVQDMVLTGMHSYQALPSKSSMLDKLERLYDSWLLCGGDWPMSKRIETQNAIHGEYSWDSIVRDQWAPLMARLADEAPPLDARFQVQGVGEFVQTVKEELAKDTPLSPLPAVSAGSHGRSGDGAPEDESRQAAAAGVPRRRVGPLVAVNGNGEAVTA